MRKYSALLVVFYLFAAALGGCTKSDSAGSSGDQARQMVRDGAVLLDVRTPQEFQRGHLPGAVNIPLALLDRKIGSLDKSRPVVVYCQSGSRSKYATRNLESAGFSVFDLGGMYNW